MSNKNTWLILLSAGILAAAGLRVSVFGLTREGLPATENRKAKTENQRIRQPVALVVADEGRRLFAANRRAGTMSSIDVDRRRVIAETKIGRCLADMIDDGAGHMLAVDEAAGELIVLTREEDSVAATARLHVGDAAVSVCRLAHSRAAVACLWPRRLAIVDLSKPAKPFLVHSIELPFAPGKLLALPGGEKIVVADAFGGRLAVVDAGRGIVESVRSLPGHNIRTLALSADHKQLLLAQQVLTEDTPTRGDDVRWGNVITNGVRSLPVADVLKPNADLLRYSRFQPLGAFRGGAADPAGLAVAGGKTIVALAGTNEVAFEEELRVDWPRVQVGRRPTAIAVSDRRVFVANTFADSVTVIDCDKRETLAEISLGSMPERTPAERGELLFFDARLSVEGWMSCHSCHSDGHTNGLRSDTLGDGSYGAPKRVPTLRGVGGTAPWAWNGSMARLEDQVRKSIETTMHGRRPTERQIADLTAYLQTLAPPPPREPATGTAVRRGEAVFRSRGCVRCHAPPHYTTSRTYDVGLEDELEHKEFNPPSLLGVGHGTAFFHDGRGTTLGDVFLRFRHQVPADMARGEVEDLLSFLRSL